VKNPVRFKAELTASHEDLDYFFHTEKSTLKMMTFFPGVLRLIKVMSIQREVYHGLQRGNEINGKGQCRHQP
jgi:hypothetical protein